MDNLPTFDQIRNLNDFNALFEIAKKYDFLKHINKFAHSSLNVTKLKNFIIACVEEKKVFTKLSSLPYRIIVDPTNACNLGCPLCPTGLNASSRKKGIMKFEKFKKLVDEIKEHCIEIHIYNWGELTLNKDLLKMIKYSKDHGIWSRISSNLSLKFKDGYLDEFVKSGLSLLHVDIDGLDQDVYEKYRRKGNLKTVYDNLSKIIELKKKYNLKNPTIELSMLAMRQNEHQHEEFLKIKEKFDVDEVKIDKIQHNPNMDEKWLPFNKDLVYETYDGNASSNSSKDSEKSQCHWPWSGIVVNWDGGINPCCIIDDPKSDFANTKDRSIKEIWNSEEYISSRSEFGDEKEITKKTICNICKNQTHSKRLNRVSKSFAIKI